MSDVVLNNILTVMEITQFLYLFFMKVSDRLCLRKNPFELHYMAWSFRGIEFLLIIFCSFYAWVFFKKQNEKYVGGVLSRRIWGSYVMKMSLWYSIS